MKEKLVSMFAGKGDPPADVVELVKYLNNLYGNVDAVLDDNELDIHFRAAKEIEGAKYTIFKVCLVKKKGAWFVSSHGMATPLYSMMRGLGVKA